MVDLAVTVVLAGIIGGASLYIYKEKKKGTKCVGCPHTKNCGGCCMHSRKQF